MSPERGIALPTKKSNAKKAGKEAKPLDLRAGLAPTPQNFTATIEAVEAVLPKLHKPTEPHRGDLVQALIHIVMAEGLPCGVGQEAVRRIENAFVDRNEFRITEAFEVAEMLEDLEIPELFERCRIVRDAVAQIYNDQNGVNLEFLREAAVGDRQNFFNRVPAIPSKVGKQLVHVISLEEAIFTDKPGQRVLQRLGIETGGEAFCIKLKELLAPFGHLPFKVGHDAAASVALAKPILEPKLSPACRIMRLAPHGKR